MLKIGEVVSTLGWIVIAIGVIWLYRLKYSEEGEKEFYISLILPFFLLSTLFNPDARKPWLIVVVGGLIALGGVFLG